MYVLIFSTAFVWNIAHSKKKWVARDYKCILVFMYTACYSCHIVIKTRIFWTDFRKILKYQISWKSVRWEPSCSMWGDGRRHRKYSHADRRDEAKYRSSQFCERAYNCYIISVLVIILIFRISLNYYTAR